MKREVRLTVRLGVPDDASATDVKVTFYRAPIVGSKGA